MKAKDRHHVVPRAKCRILGIPHNFPGNVRKVPVSKHRAFHTLFGASTCEEAIEILKRDWSLSPEAKREFERLTGNVALIRKRS